MGRGEIWSKGVSGAIAAVYALYAAVTGGMSSAAVVLLMLLLPLGLIWFGDDIELPDGWLSDGPSGRTPGSIVRFVGWVLLLLPIIIPAYLKYGRHA